jgi:hypothetical protein
MMNAELIRVEKGESGTFGVLKIDGRVFCVTLEPQDKGNKKNISCIPEGTYTCKRNMSPKYGETFEITNVPNRSHVLIHSGNVVKHTKGCVLLARKFGVLGEDRAILNSGGTFNEFMKKTSLIDEFELTIKEVI